MKKIFILLILVYATGANAQQQPFSDTTLLFEPDRDGYSIMHVPALVVTKKGVLLAFAEGRAGNGQDWAEMDLLMRRSIDKGRHWEPVTVVVPHTTGVPTSNITPIVDENGTVHLLYHVDYARAYYMKSTNDGKTWSRPVDITSAFNGFSAVYNWKVLAPGPGHGIQLKNGRLVVPVWLCIPNKNIPGGDHRPSCTATIYSDDHGKTWKSGAIIANTGDKIAGSTDTVVNPSETVALQLADGRVMVNMRNECAPNKRLISYSPDGSSNWSTPVLDEQLFEPVCMASLLRLSGNKPNSINRILFVNPDSRDNATEIRKGQKVYKPRERLAAKLSYDEGRTWPVEKVLFEKGAGYSDLAVDKDGTIYCLYEIRDGDDNDWKYRIVIQRFNLEWLTAGKDFTGKKH
ncbi:sialidase-1 [Chitinophaga ginsengisegetis]|uniref:exo-alpha-sialidase n=1 Tax=Chitinophaga ginsengisegetis TaxID=393003 RepID=A0A1T5NEX5_9BACT|nr:sialidase family protein [Chitinophaga ginsengisegetis]SKC99031.1 sialidase-1 [Chitinophaga ginsengisegetis]